MKLEQLACDVAQDVEAWRISVPPQRDDSDIFITDFANRAGRLVNMLFAAYIAGMVHTMDPKSKWNTHFREGLKK